MVLAEAHEDTHEPLEPLARLEVLRESPALEALLSALGNETRHAD